MTSRKWTVWFLGKRSKFGTTFSFPLFFLEEGKFVVTIINYRLTFLMFSFQLQIKILWTIMNINMRYFSLIILIIAVIRCDRSYTFLSTSLLSGPKDALGSAYIFPSPALQSITSLGSPGPFQWKTGFRNQYVGTRCAHCYRGTITARPSQWKELANISVITRGRKLREGLTQKD